MVLPLSSCLRWILLLLFGVPDSPLAALPRRALGLAKVNPVEGIKEPVNQIRAQVASGVQSAWMSTSVKLERTTLQIEAEVDRLSSSAVEQLMSEFGTFWNRGPSDRKTDEPGTSSDDANRNQGDES